MRGYSSTAAESAHRGGHWTALASQVRMRQSSPSRGLVQAPVAHLQPLKSPSHTTAYAYLYLSDVGHTCVSTRMTRVKGDHKDCSGATAAVCGLLPALAKHRFEPI